MSSKWTVVPEEVRIDLHVEGPGAFWIRIKKHLTIGEERYVQTAGWKGVSSTPQASRGGEPKVSSTEIQIDWKAQSFARTVAYLRAWSLTDDNDKPLPATRDTVEQLRSDVYGAIEESITKHVEAMEEEKKLTSGRLEPKAISA